MSDFRFADVGMLHLLWLLPATAMLMVFAARRRARALRRFVDAGLLGRFADHALPDPSRRVLKAALFLSGMALVALALARPGWDAVREEVTQSGRDVVFLLDVSRSMLAEDLPPNRLERAKLAIRDALERLDGDRVALAAFAGGTVVKCPLTLDYGFFRMALDDVSPASVARGGSLIGDALREVVSDVFDAKRSNVRDIVLITDGEDHESFPVEAAAQAGAQGVRLIAIGLGDEQSGRRIPAQRGDAATSRSFLRYQGQEVWSKLDAATLRRMAQATPGGVYVNAATGAVDLGAIYSRLIARAEGAEIASRSVERVEEKFQLFLIGCLILLALEIALRDRSSRRVVAMAACWAALGSLAPIAGAASLRGLVNGGNDSYRAEQYGNALSAYDQALEQEPDSPYASFNRANALYRAGRFPEAADAYSAAVLAGVDAGLGQIQSAGLHGLGNARYREAEGAAETDPGSATRLLESAATAYADALRADASRTDSAHNLELARRMIQKLRERASSQPQGSDGAEQEGEQEQQGRESALRQAAEDQDRLADESREQAQDRRQRAGEAAREQQEQREQDLAQQQADLERRTQQLSEGAGKDAQQELEDAARHQEQAQASLKDGEPADAEQSQRAAAEALRRAAEQSSDSGSQQQAAEAQAGDSSAEPSAQEEGGLPETTADQILAKERQDRVRRQLQRVGVIAVEKDW